MIRRSHRVPSTVARWLSVEEIRKRERCRRSLVIDAMLSGALPYERRGRIRYARVSDVEHWAESRLERRGVSTVSLIHPDLAKLAES